MSEEIWSTREVIRSLAFAEPESRRLVGEWLRKKLSDSVLSAGKGRWRASGINGALASNDGVWPSTRRRSERRLQTAEVRRDLAERTVAWWDATMNARALWMSTHIPATEAARILVRADTDADAASTTTESVGPDDFKRLREAFVNSGRGPSPLADWIEVARSRRCKYHEWVEEYRDAARVLSASDLLLTPSASIAPSQRLVEVACAVGGSAAIWSLKEPRRYQGYGRPLYRTLKAAYDSGSPKPGAQDVLDMWRQHRHDDIAEVLEGEFKYLDSKHNIQTADLDALKKAIDRMTA